MSIWNWFVAKKQEYRDSGDAERLEMAQIHLQAFKLRETDPQAMLRMYTDGRDRARRLGESWWEYLYEVWIAIAYGSYLMQLDKALPQALHCVNEGQQPHLTDHPWRIAAHNTLLKLYVDIDPIGHAAAIEECLRNLAREIPEDEFEHRYVLYGQETLFLIAHGRWEEARQQCLNKLALFERHDFKNDSYLISTYLSLCEIYWRERGREEILRYAQQAEETARRRRAAQLSLANAQVWLAVATRLYGDEETARRYFRSALNRISRLHTKPDAGHYDAMIAFLELGEDLESCLRVREEQLEHIQGTGRFSYECELQIKRCELLARLGRLTPEDLARARPSLKRLKNPQPYQQRLDQLAEPGSCSQQV
ncbi:MAG: hypothetical protein AB7K24_05950 [Gemmataceae bacterium]